MELCTDGTVGRGLGGAAGDRCGEQLEVHGVECGDLVVQSGRIGVLLVLDVGS